MGFVGVVQFVNRLLIRVPVVQTVVLLEGFGPGIRGSESQNAVTASSEHSLFDLELELVRAVTPVLYEVVGQIREDRIRSQQVLGGDTRIATDAGPRNDSEKRVRELPIQIAVVCKPYSVVLKAPAVHVVTVVDKDLIVTGIRRLKHNSARNFTLESDRVLIGPWNLKSSRVEADAVSDVGRQPSSRTQRNQQSIGEWVGERISSS